MCIGTLSDITKENTRVRIECFGDLLVGSNITLRRVFKKVNIRYVFSTNIRQI